MLGWFDKKVREAKEKTRREETINVISLSWIQFSSGWYWCGNGVGELGQLVFSLSSSFIIMIEYSFLFDDIGGGQAHHHHHQYYSPDEMGDEVWVFFYDRVAHYQQHNYERCSEEKAGDFRLQPYYNWKFKLISFTVEPWPSNDGIVFIHFDIFKLFFLSGLGRHLLKIQLLTHE